jgi:sugar-specific transcriptional regulator TrmB
LVSVELLELFVALGLTRLQATVYLTLLEAGETDIRAIFLLSKLPRLDVDVALFELEELGLVKNVNPFE